MVTKINSVIGRISGVCQPYISRMSAVCQPYISTVCQPYIRRISAVCQPWNRRMSAVYQPYVSRMSAVCQPYIHDRMSAIADIPVISQFATQSYIYVTQLGAFGFKGLNLSYSGVSLGCLGVRLGNSPRYIWLRDIEYSRKYSESVF